MSTLRYADQAKSIVNSVKVNEDPFARTVRRLQEEVSGPARQTGRPGLVFDLIACATLPLSLQKVRRNTSFLGRTG